MLYSKHASAEDRIVELAVDGRVTVRSLHETLAKKHDLTLRAVYKAVNKLVDAGVLLKVGKQVMADQEWARRAAGTLGAVSGPALSGGERVAYTFTSVEHLDSFWKTVVLPLGAREIFFYNPHNFWAYLPERKGSEDAYYQHFAARKQYGFFTVGGETAADKEFKRSYQSEHLQIDLREVSGFRRTDHITIVDSLVITVRLAKSLSDRIDRLYSSGTSIEDMLPQISAVCRKPGKIRFLIENNQAKAARLRKSLSRNFYIQHATKIPTA